MSEKNVPSKAAVTSMVHDVVLGVVRRTSPQLKSVQDSDALNAKLGLKSLDLAQIVAVLEMRLEADPFAEFISVTSIRTVGDLRDAYVNFMNAGTAGAPAAAPAAARDGAASRGAARRQAAAPERRRKA